MKIIFLNGSTEAGKDGVGDYLRRLSGALIRQGHSASILSFNDTYITDVEQTEQEEEGTAIPVFRLSSQLSNKERYKRAGEYIKAVDPDWLSLHYVPYSYQKKGLPFGLNRKLAKIGKGRKWHIMFHELWAGMDNNDPTQLKWIGNIQRIIVKNLVKTLNPIHIHTHTHLYQKLLSLSNIQATLLPLFGNIPVKFNKSRNDSSVIIFLLFGGIHYGANVSEFSEWLFHIQESENKKALVYFIGKNGNELNIWEECFKNNKVGYKIIGIQDELTISQLMSNADIGITTTPYFLIEKSGSVAAMLEHELPILCVAREWIPRNINFNFYHNIPYWQPDLQLKDITGQKINSHNLQDIAKLFINSILN